MDVEIRNREKKLIELIKGSPRDAKLEVHNAELIIEMKKYLAGYLAIQTKIDVLVP